MPLPYSPEPFESLKARYPLAVADVIDLADMAKPDGPRPGELLQHTFHTEDGLVLIVSRERHPNGKICVHFSTSLHQPSKAWDTALAFPVARLALAWFIGYSETTWRALSGWRGPVHFIGTTEPKGIPHFIAWQGE